MRMDRLEHAGGRRRFPHGALDASLANVMALPTTGTRIGGDALGREEILPAGLTLGVGVLAAKGIGHVHGPKTGLQVRLVEFQHAGDLAPKPFFNALG
jgi:hypothetical protein